MFTGLIEDVGSVVGLTRSGTAAVLTVKSSLPAAEVRLGDSIAVNGVCLTVTGFGSDSFIFDVSPETLERTAFRFLNPGSPVNLERALRLTDRLGGHLVTGHVDCVASVEERREGSGNILFAFRIPAAHGRYLVAKGSVTVDGISLTVNTVTASTFTVNVIPHTSSHTTLKGYRPGNMVNIETDLIGKYVERLLTGQQPAGGDGLTLAALARNGFL